MLTPERLELDRLTLRLAQSRLDGRLTALFQNPVPRVDIQFTAPVIQLDEFLFEDWSPRDMALSDGKESPAAGRQQPAELFSPQILQQFNAGLVIQADQVTLGKDQLGSGTLSAELNQGRITLDPLVLNLPGGSLTFSMSIKPDPIASTAWIKADIDDFDINILARHALPESDMGGRFSLDLALETRASVLEDILANGNGYLDFSARPENVRAGIIDLWAVNLVIAAVARSDKDQSQIECLLGRWSMKDGYLVPDAFVIDTSRMRICGRGWADFKKEFVSIRVAPVPKKPAFFSLATPIQIQGKFSEFDLGIVPGGIVGTALKFVTSPIHVPMATLGGFKLPRDGSDVCSTELGPNNRPTQPPAGCRGFYQ